MHDALLLGKIESNYMYPSLLTMNHLPNCYYPVHEGMEYIVCYLGRFSLTC